MKTPLHHAIGIVLTASICFGEDTLPVAPTIIGEVTDIGSRRELFCHSALVNQNLTTATRLIHHPEPAGTVMRQDAPWEGNSCSYGTIFKDGDVYRMYYIAANLQMQGKNYILNQGGLKICYAESKDGFNWIRPSLGICEWEGKKENNILFDQAFCNAMDNFMIFKDANPNCPEEERYKALMQYTRVRKPYGKDVALWLFAGATPTGLKPTREIVRIGPHEKTYNEGGIMIDTQSTAYWDAERNIYHLYTRGFHRVKGDRFGDTHIRDVRHATSPDFKTWSEFEFLDFGPDAEDYPLYTNVIGPYMRAPHIVIGFPTRYVERKEWTDSFDNLPGVRERKIKMAMNPRFGLAITDTIFMCSRDGQRFECCDEAFMTPGPQAKDNWIYGDCYIYYGQLVTPGRYGKDPELSFYHFERDYASTVTKVQRYCLRMDGFMSYFGTYVPQKVVTRKLRYRGDKMLLNMSTSARGSIRVKIRDLVSTKEIVSSEIIGDEIDREIKFANGTVKEFSGKPVVIEFELSDSHIYAYKFE